MPVTTSKTTPEKSVFDDPDDDEDGWQEMPIIREDEFASGLDEEDQKKYHYVPSATKNANVANATGNLLDIDDRGNEWRSKLDQNESEYTRLRVNEEDEADEVHLRTKYLFDEDKAMTPLSQMQATKNLLTEAQRIAYVGLCALTSREMSHSLKIANRKELKGAVTNMELWAMKIMGRLYYHMELETAEQKMIESLAEHGVQAADLVPALMTTHTVANPEYDPEEARKRAEEIEERTPDHPDDLDGESISDQTIVATPTLQSPSFKGGMPASDSGSSVTSTSTAKGSTTTRILEDTSTAAMPGVTTTLSAADKDVTLDIRWTVLCDLFLILIADSVYDARSRVLLENVALKLGLGWLDVVKFESRVTEALEIQEDVEKMENQEVIEGQQKAGKRRRYMMLGLATLGGGLVIGLSAGLLAPVIGAGLGAAFTTIGIGGTTGFLAGTGGAAVITTGGVLTGSSIAARGMANRTQQVRTFELLPLHNNKRVNCILTVPGFMTGLQDDVRLPFSVLDPIVGDVFSVLWEPEMIRETGSALKILTGEILSQIGLTVLSATVMATLMSALQWPIILTKLGYLIDNPWNNALDRAKGAGRVLADVLIKRHLGVRPITLIGFSLGARVIFYALLELAKSKAFGIVQDVILLGATLTASSKTWCEARSVVSGRFVNGFAQNDWVLNYLFRATSGGVGTVAGLRPVDNVPGLENVDVTDKIAGHMSYRAFMPLILDQLGFPVSADYFDEPEEPDFQGDRIVEREEEEKKTGWFSRKKTKTTPQKPVSRPPSTASYIKQGDLKAPAELDDDLPPRMSTSSPQPSTKTDHSRQGSDATAASTSQNELPVHAGFDFNAIRAVLGEAEKHPEELNIRQPLPLRDTGKSRMVSLSSSSSPPPRPHSAAPPEPSTRATSEQPERMKAIGSGTLPTSPHSRSDLSASFARSASLSDIRSFANDQEPTRNIPWQNSSHETPTSFTSFRSSNLSSLASSSSPPSSEPSLTFGNIDGSLWATSSDTTTNPFGSSNSFSATPFSASSSSTFAPVADNPFLGAASHSPGLSFGTEDGSISGISGLPPVEPDPWSFPSTTTRKPGKKQSSNVFGGNPWG